MFIGAWHAEGQSLSINGAGSATLPTASDFASDVMGDPWDFEQRSDFMYMMSDNNTKNSAFQSLPDVTDGLLRGVINQENGQVNLMIHWEGVTGALNSMTKTGVKYPINADKYRRLSLRMRRDREINATPEANRVGAQWFTAERLSGGLIEQGAAGRYGNLGYFNQSPVADQGKSTYHIYTMDLDQGVGPTPWGGTLAGLSLKLSTLSAMAGATMELDWVRLSARSQVGANLQWSGFSGRVTLTASNAATGDVVQVYPSPGTNDFGSSGSYTWDYGFLPAGTWTIRARAGSQTATATLNIDASPVLNITEPDASGGRDFATTTFGDAWDLTNPQDVFRHGQLYQIPLVAFTELGLDGVTQGDDSFVMLAGHNGMKIPAQTYHRLTYTIQYDHEEFMIWNVLNPDPANAHNGGNIMRIVWNHSGGAVQDFRVSQDIFCPDGFPQTYTVDLKTLDNTVTEVEPVPSGQLWRDTNEMGLFRLDIHEAPAQRAFRLSKVKLAADDEPNGNGFFMIKWNVADNTLSRQFASGNGSDATIDFYYDTDLDPSQKTLIASGVSAAAGQYAWDVSQLTPNVQYYVVALIADGSGNSQLRYSTGPMRLRAAYPAGLRTDSNSNGLPDQWEAANSVSNPGEDTDNDGLTNLQEYQAGTNPLISNVWNLSEGATGFFVQRLALSNPDGAAADVSIKYLRSGGKPPVTRDYTVLPYGRLTINVNDIAGFATEDVSAVIQSVSGGVLAERTMFWGDGFYGGHTGKAIQSARNEWFLAEGAANSFFSTFILLANATNSPAQVNLMFLRENAPPFTIGVNVDANSRYTIPTNTIDGLNGFSFATKITSNVPISVERSMYINSNPDRPFEGGHESAAVPEAKTEWYVAEGQASDFFSMFVLLANPNASPTQVTVRYLMPGREPTSKVLELGANSRYTIDIGNPVDAPGVANTDVSVEVKANLPIVVERAMYWPKNGARWTDGHNSAGVTSTGTTWALAEGELGGSRGFQTYVLMANPSNTDAAVRMTLLREGEGRGPLSIDFTVPANQRVTKSAQDFVGLGLQSGEKFGVVVTSLNGAPIVVERAMYWNGGGEFWGAGTNETGFKLR